MVEDGKMSIANTPFFSIIVPVFNTDQKYLKRCFESIDSQAGPSFEVLVVDDGSTNGAGQYCDEWAAQHPHFRVLHQGNSGVSTARNKGISNAVGDYVLFVDSDDYLMPNALNTFSENMSVGGADMCITDVSISDGEKHTTARVFPDQTAHFLTNKEQRKCLLQIIAGIGASFVGANITDVWGKAYKRAFLEIHSIRFCNTLSINEDGLFNISVLSEAERILYAAQTSYVYEFNHDGSLTHKWRPNAKQQADAYRNQLQGTIASILDDEDIRNAVIQMNIGLIFWIIYYDIKHRENPATVNEKVSQIRQLISAEPYESALKHCKLRWFSVHDCIKIVLLRIKACRIYLQL